MEGSGRQFDHLPCATQVQPFERNYSRPDSIRAELEHAPLPEAAGRQRDAAERSRRHGSRILFHPRLAPRRDNSEQVECERPERRILMFIHELEGIRALELLVNNSSQISLLERDN